MRSSLAVSGVVVLCAVACGDDNTSGHLPDAPPPPGDTTAPPEPITLTITRNGMPVAGVHTYFLRADGSLAETVGTNGQGVASSTKAGGGSVTAIDPFIGVVNPAGAPSYDLRTFLGVKAGDHLVLTQNDAAMTVTLTAKTAEAANSYNVVTTCGSGSIAPVVNGLTASDPTGEIMLSGCNGSADILVIARGGRGTRALYHPNVPLTDGDEVNLTGEDDTYQDVGSVAFNYMLEQLPTGALTTSYTLGTGRGKFWNLEQRRDDVVEENVLLVTLGDVPTIDRAFGLIDTSLRVPGGTQPDDRILESLYNVINRRPAAETYVIAMTSTTNALLPAFSSFPSYNPTTQRISWIEALGGVAPDLTVARITVSHGGARLQWTLAAPHTPGEVTFPTLPSDVADFTPVAGDQVLDLRLVNAKVPGHYDGVRAHILDAHLEEGDRSGTALATAGNVVTVEATIPVPDPGPFLREAPGREPLVDPLRSVR